MCDYPATYRVAVFGLGGVGKSSLTIRFISNEFCAVYDPTIEESYRKKVTIDGKPIVLEILDTAGREEFSPTQDMWIQTSDGFLIVQDITSHITFDEITIIRNKILRGKDKEIVPIVIAGNKGDLTNERKVTNEEGIEFSKEYNVPFYQTSAKDGINCQECFYQTVREIWRIYDQENDQLQQKSSKRKKERTYCSLL